VKVFWLDRQAAIEELRLAAQRLLDQYPEVTSVGLFGSLAAGTSTPGSDADILIIFESELELPFHERASRYQPEVAGIGIGVDFFCYTPQEIFDNRFASDAAASALWLARRSPLQLPVPR
jgi:predicted nucleotidyltransferase